MSDIEKKARELLVTQYRDLGIEPQAARLMAQEHQPGGVHYAAVQAIVAALAPPKGYVLVPVEPTEAMKDAFQGFRPVQRTNFACRYEEMLAVRPEVSGG